jgi:hypothetical protein
MTTPTFDQCVRSPDHVLVRELGGESLLLNLDSETYFGLDDVGTRMWTLLVASPSIEHALAALCAEYGVEDDILRRDLAALLDELLDHGLLVVADAPT